MQDVLPSLFQVYVGGVPGAAYAVELEGEYLRYDTSLAEVHENKRPRKIRPSRASWEHFWQEVSGLGIWNWRPHYVRETPAEEGEMKVSWRFAIHYQGLHVVSVGDNAYPSETGATELRTEDEEADARVYFERFNQAVCRLIGGLPFRAGV